MNGKRNASQALKMSLPKACVAFNHEEGVDGDAVKQKE